MTIVDWLLGRKRDEYVESNDGRQRFYPRRPGSPPFDFSQPITPELLEQYSTLRDEVIEKAIVAWAANQPEHVGYLRRLLDARRSASPITAPDEG